MALVLISTDVFCLSKNTSKVVANFKFSLKSHILIIRQHHIKYQNTR